MSGTLSGLAGRLGGPGLFVAALAGAGLLFGAGLATSNTSPAQQTGAAPIKIGDSGLPIPRFVSLKADRVNVRNGPGKNHAITWVFAKQGLPVEIINEYSNWRQVRDSEGAEGWVFHSLLSGRRTALVAPWERASSFTLRTAPDQDARAVAAVEAGVLVRLEDCSGTWCRVVIDAYEGWLQQDSLWGAYPGERVN